MKPLTATMPRSSLPGSTRRPSSVNTATRSPSMNFGGLARGALRARATPPRPTASVDPNESNSITFGMCSSRPLLVPRGSTSRPTSEMRFSERQVALAGVRVERLHHRSCERLADDDERVHVPVLARRATARRRRTCGRASVTTDPPRFIVMSDENCPVPCMSGHADSVTGSGAPALTLARSRSPASAADVIGARPSSG